jgi:phage terminase small subunit
MTDHPPIDDFQLEPCGPLRPKHRRFVDEYLKDFNGAAAIRRCGYPTEAPGDLAWNWLQREAVQEAIREAIEERARRTLVDQDQVIHELAQIAFSDITDFVEWDEHGIVSMKPSRTLPKGRRRAITEVSQTAQGVKIKVSDKTRALELLARHLNMFVDRVETTNKITIQRSYGEPVETPE